MSAKFKKLKLCDIAGKVFVDPDEAAHYESLDLKLPCLHLKLFSFFGS